VPHSVVGGRGSAANSKLCEHCHAAKAQAKVTFNGVVLKLCKPCLEIEQKRVAMSRLCERCAQGKQVRADDRMDQKPEKQNIRQDQFGGKEKNKKNQMFSNLTPEKNDKKKKKKKKKSSTGRQGDCGRPCAETVRCLCASRACARRSTEWQSAGRIAAALGARCFRRSSGGGEQQERVVCVAVSQCEHAVGDIEHAVAAARRAVRRCA
jgi:hypothetical protein